MHYDADLTSIPQRTESEVAKTGQLLLGIVTLVLIGCSAAVLLGFFLGGGRAFIAWRGAGRSRQSTTLSSFGYISKIKTTVREESQSASEGSMQA